MSTLPETTDTSIVAQWDSGEWIAPIKFDITDLAEAIDAPAASDVAVEPDNDTAVTSNITEVVSTRSFSDDAKHVILQNHPKKKKTKVPKI